MRDEEVESRLFFRDIWLLEEKKDLCLRSEILKKGEIRLIIFKV